MQPSLGLNLKSLLFEPVTGDIENTVREDILSTLATWLPFVQIRELDVVVEGSGEFDRNKIKINLTFGLNQIPNMFESVQIEI
jgi:phage baseplate assembly protein W